MGTESSKTVAIALGNPYPYDTHPPYQVNANPLYSKSGSLCLLSERTVQYRGFKVALQYLLRRVSPMACSYTLGFLSSKVSIWQYNLMNIKSLRLHLKKIKAISKFNVLLRT